MIRPAALVPRGALAWDLGTLAAVALAVQLLFSTRMDWVGHVLAGGAIVIVVDALLGRRWGAWAVTAGAALALGLAILTDQTLTGPFDPGDVAFTLGGALLVLGRHDRARADGSERGPRREAPSWVAVVWGLAVFALALYWRYDFRAGP